MKQNIVIEWNRTPEDESYLTAVIVRDDDPRFYLGISQASIDRLHRYIEGMHPQVWGGGGYWGGSYELQLNKN